MNPEEATTGPAMPSRTATAAGLVIVILASSLDTFVPPFGVPVALVAVWLLVRNHGGAASLGLTRPKSWRHCIALGAAASVVFQAIGTLVSSSVLPALGLDPPDLSAFSALQGNPLRLLGMLTVSWTTAGFGEEVIWRGFALTRLESLLGGGRSAAALSLVMTSTLFGLLHSYQGVGGMVLTGFAALLLGGLFLATGRNLWLVIVTHAMMDTLAFVLLYFFADQLG